MRGIIVKNSFNKSLNTEYKIERLKEEFKKYDVELDVFRASDLKLHFDQGRYQTIDLSKYSFCVYLDKDRYLASAINSILPTFNSANSMIYCDDKMLTYEKLQGLKIKTPLTIPCPLNYSNNIQSDFTDYVIDKLHLPLIAKSVYGSLGKQVYLLNTKEDVENYYKKYSNIPHIYQEYISYEFGTDYRLITVGGKVVGRMKRKNDFDFRSNIALGGKGEKVELNSTYDDLAIKVSEALGLDYAGIDILKGENDMPILNEVNSNAYFTEVEKVTKNNITGELVKHILNKISN
ncbi:MAG TPA: hypothetical protein DCY93_00365 [Firmicutes bacterium]|nr:hypothetical protein [Bacillota bacterium]